MIGTGENPHLVGCAIFGPKFLENGRADVHGTKMVISVPDAEDRNDIIAYLKTLKP